MKRLQLTYRLKKIVLTVVQYTGFAILLVLFIIPFVWMVSTSVKSIGETLTNPPIFIPSDFHFENYVKAWKSGPFLHFFLNSAIITFSSMILQLLFVVPAAYAFARCKFRGKTILFGITMMTLMIPGQLIFMPLFLIFSKMGLINSYASMILPFSTSAFGIFMLRQSFMQIPEELLEAARLDQASEWQIIRHIMVPMARPTIVTLMLLTFISRWNDYFWPLVMTTNDKVRTLSIGVSMLKNTEGGASWNVLMAGNVILVLPILIVFVCAQRQIIRAFTYTGEK
ncbi:carbohydrate ABC transporter permease [Hungatella sp.]|uniref:carbohydrate ABC transporter permease n=1 Tax=Hungatella sp. TaxID=2613924 RepID=UPI002A7EBD65|nr:carbohydrate ABC transporter permease [Hungatella sp.]